MTLDEWVAHLIHRESKDWTSLLTKAKLHKVSKDEAATLAPIIVRATETHDVPLPYLLATIRQESAFDPRAINPNGHPGVLLKTDWGIAQISGANLIAMFPTLTDAERAEKAFDPRWAIPWMAKTYASLIKWAHENFSHWNNLWVATLAYNRGRTGARRILWGDADETLRAKGYRHANSVMRFYDRYSEERRSIP